MEKKQARWRQGVWGGGSGHREKAIDVHFSFTSSGQRSRMKKVLMSILAGYLKEAGGG